MKIIFLGPYNERIIDFLRTISDQVIHQEKKICAEELINQHADFVISYRYRYIISKAAVSYYENKMINLHISFLPWNKGADPNLWSFLEDTKKGVTIHYVDEGIDTGDIIAQKEIGFSNDDTLVTSYQKLTDAIEDLFIEIWPRILTGQNERIAQSGRGSYHKSSDKEKYLHLLTDSWNTSVQSIRGTIKLDPY